MTPTRIVNFQQSVYSAGNGASEAMPLSQNSAINSVENISQTNTLNTRAQRGTHKTRRTQKVWIKYQGKLCGFAQENNACVAEMLEELKVETRNTTEK